MKITEHAEALEELKARLFKQNQEKDKLRNSNGAIHTSDLVLCLRQKAYQRLIPKPPSLEELGYFVDGNTGDRALKSLFIECKGEQVEGVWFTPDAEDEAGDLKEFKATRFNSGLSSHFGTQLSYYLAQKNRPTGTLIIRRLIKKYPKKGEPDTWKPFEAYKVTLEPGEREAILEEIRSKKFLLSAALESKNPKLAPGVREDSELNWCCTNCSYKDECWTKY